MMPAKQTEKILDVTIISDSQSSQAEEPPLTDNTDTEITVTADIKYNTNNTDETVAKSEESQTPEILPPVSCSTELAQHRTNKDPDQTPTGSPQKGSNSVNKGVVEYNIEVEENKPKIVEGGKGIRRSNRIKNAKKVNKMGAIEYFWQLSNCSRSKAKKPEEDRTLHPEHSQQREGRKQERLRHSRMVPTIPKRGECRGESYIV